MAAKGFFSVDSLAGVHALVVDHDQACRDLLSSILRYCGALVTTTASSKEALTVMSIAKCDVVVIDLILHGESGADLIRRIRRLKPEHGGVVRAIAVSGRSQDRDAAVGADSTLTSRSRSSPGRSVAWSRRWCSGDVVPSEMIHSLATRLLAS
jgi:CheY-like chemotaxis protein